MMPPVRKRIVMHEVRRHKAREGDIKKNPKQSSQQKKRSSSKKGGKSKTVSKSNEAEIKKINYEIEKLVNDHLREAMRTTDPKEELLKKEIREKLLESDDRLLEGDAYPYLSTWQDWKSVLYEYTKQMMEGKPIPEVTIHKSLNRMEISLSNMKREGEEIKFSFAVKAAETQDPKIMQFNRDIDDLVIDTVKKQIQNLQKEIEQDPVHSIDTSCKKQQIHDLKVVMVKVKERRAERIIHNWILFKDQEEKACQLFLEKEKAYSSSAQKGNVWLAEPVGGVGIKVIGVNNSDSGMKAAIKVVIQQEVIRNSR